MLEGTSGGVYFERMRGGPSILGELVALYCRTQNPELARFGGSKPRAMRAIKLVFRVFYLFALETSPVVRNRC